MAADLHYYNGDCTTSQAQRQIKYNFIQMINGSRFWQNCQDPDFGNRCTAENVKVTCARVPAVVNRKKRSSGKLLQGHVCICICTCIFGKGVKPLIVAKRASLLLYFYMLIVNCIFKRLLWTWGDIKQKPIENASSQRKHKIDNTFITKRGMVIEVGAIFTKSWIRRTLGNILIYKEKRKTTS